MLKKFYHPKPKRQFPQVPGHYNGVFVGCYIGRGLVASRGCQSPQSHRPVLPVLEAWFPTQSVAAETESPAMPRRSCIVSSFYSFPSQSQERTFSPSLSWSLRWCLLGAIIGIYVSFFSSFQCFVCVQHLVLWCQTRIPTSEKNQDKGFSAKRRQRSRLCFPIQGPPLIVSLSGCRFFHSDRCFILL